MNVGAFDVTGMELGIWKLTDQHFTPVLKITGCEICDKSLELGLK